MLQIRQDPTVESQHVFYSASLETPVGLLASFPQVRRIGRGQAEDAEIAILQTATVLWWHLTPGASVAEQFKFIRQRASTAAVSATGPSRASCGSGTASSGVETAPTHGTVTGW